MDGESWTPGTEPSDIPYSPLVRWDLEQLRPQTSDLIASNDEHASNLIAQNHQFRHREIQMQTELQSLEDTIRKLHVKQDHALQQKDTKIASLEQDIIIQKFAHSHELRDREKQTQMKLKSLEETIRTLSSRTQCLICYSDAGWIVACGHMFCRGCIDVWKAENEVFQCPICRKLYGGGYPMIFTT